jgi:hypothetical protein
MSAKIRITKTDSNNFNVHFSDSIKGPQNLAAASEVPVEWMQSVLEYYIKNADKNEGLSGQHLKDAIAAW